jgi:hypothetical protein
LLCSVGTVSCLGILKVLNDLTKGGQFSAVSTAYIPLIIHARPAWNEDRKVEDPRHGQKMYNHKDRRGPYGIYYSAGRRKSPEDRARVSRVQDISTPSVH